MPVLTIAIKIQWQKRVSERFYYLLREEIEKLQNKWIQYVGSDEII